MNIKTVTTTAGINKVVFGNSPDVYYWVKNIGEITLTGGFAETIIGQITQEEST